MEVLSFSDCASALVERGPGHVELAALRFKGIFDVECVDQDGNTRWRDTARNGVTSTGLDLVLNNVFRGVTQLAGFYVGLVDNGGWTGYNLTDTMASHASPNAWAELASASISNSTRPQWSPAAPSGNAITNTTTMDFAMVATATVKGLFLVGGASGTADTKAGTGGTLFSTASFSGGTQTVNNGDTLKVTYTISAANSASNT